MLQGRELSELRARLQRSRQELLETDPVSRSYAQRSRADKCAMDRFSRVAALQAREMSRETERRRRLSLHRVETALQQLETGDYGYCRYCREPIDSARLRADPSVGSCLHCAS